MLGRTPGQRVRLRVALCPGSRGVGLNKLRRSGPSAQGSPHEAWSVWENGPEEEDGSVAVPWRGGKVLQGGGTDGRQSPASAGPALARRKGLAWPGDALDGGLGLPRVRRIH